MWTQSWLFYALMGAIAAAGSNLCGRVGMQDVDSTLATAIRSIVMVIFVVAISLARQSWQHIGAFKKQDLAFVVLSGLFGASSWLMSFKALSLPKGDIFRAASIDKLSVPIAVVLAVPLLGERPATINWLGVALIVGGAYLVSIPR